MRSRATRRLLFTALLLFARTLVVASTSVGTVPVGAWLVVAARGVRGRAHRSDVTPGLIAQVLAWAWAWWIVAGGLSRWIRRAPQGGGRESLSCPPF